MAVVVNVGLDVLLIPQYGITGAAIGWAAAIIVTNLVPLAQLAVSVRLHPFGRGSFIAAGLAVLSFAVIPLAVRAGFGRGGRRLAERGRRRMPGPGGRAVAVPGQPAAGGPAGGVAPEQIVLGPDQVRPSQGGGLTWPRYCFS